MAANSVLSLLITVFLVTVNSASASGPESSAHRVRAERRNFLTPLYDPSSNAQDIGYKCWEPANGPAHPIVTIATAMLSEDEQSRQFVRNSRIAYALRHGYRYCELNTIADHHRIPSFSKIPFVLSLLSCSDYVIYLDANATIVNHALSFAPWLAHMQAKNIDLLLSANCIPESPINFGVFALRPAPWVPKFFKELYNRCSCDWSRLRNWPAEQGMVYDLLVESRSQPWFHRAQIAKTTGWSRCLHQGFTGNNLMREDDLVVHMNHVPLFQAQGQCQLGNEACQFSEIRKHHEQAVADKLIPAPLDFSDSDLRQSTCLPLRVKSLISAEVTYANRDQRFHGSLLDWHSNYQHFINEITIGEVACFGQQDANCNLGKHWDWKKGSGPWMPQHVDPLATPPLDLPWVRRGRRGGRGRLEAAGRKAGEEKCTEVVKRAKGELEKQCQRPCVDAVLLYHPDDKGMFVDNGVLTAAKKHLKGIRNIYVISDSDSDYKHLLDNRTFWVDEKTAPFKPADWAGARRPQGWLFQQALKFWAPRGIKGICNNVFFSDSDTLWLRDYDPVTLEESKEGGCKVRFKYNVATSRSGAWDGDIVNPEYHHFVEWFTGLPKAKANEWTAIHHHMLMQRDVVEALERSLVARGKGKNLFEALTKYGKEFNGISEYESYFSFAWYFFQDRLDPQNVPYVMKEPKLCGYDDPATKVVQEKSILAYFTCHDNYGGDPYYTNCIGREQQCDHTRQQGSVHA